MNTRNLKDFHLSFYHSIEVRNPSAEDRLLAESCLKTDAAAASMREETAWHRFFIYQEDKASLKQIKLYFQKKQ